MSRCPKCGSYKIEFKREDAGFRKTSIGSRREHRTIGFCKECGYTWVLNGPSFDRKRTSTSKLMVGLLGIGLLILTPILIVSFIQARVNDFHNSVKSVSYVVDETNVNLVTNPTDEYVISILNNIDGIMDTYSATIKDDPNDLFSKDTGATSVIFFSYNKVDQEKISGETLLEKGTQCGGCIEVFLTEEQALARDKHLGIFSISGSHKVVGTVIVRTSSDLSKEEQDSLEEMICKGLLGY